MCVQPPNHDPQCQVRLAIHCHRSKHEEICCTANVCGQKATKQALQGQSGTLQSFCMEPKRAKLVDHIKGHGARARQPLESDY